MKMGRWGSFLVGLALLGAVVSGCGDDGEEPGGGASGDGDGETDGEDDDIDLGDNTGGGALTPCASDEECEVPELCHPVGRACVEAGGPCAASGECSGGSYCDAGLGVCLPGLPGSPCEMDENCSTGSSCLGDTCACLGFVQEQEQTTGPLDIYFIFDRTASMGQDCAYEYGETPPENSKACFATYALSDYLVDVEPLTSTRLGFQFMSYPDGCDGTPYAEPLVELTDLPVPLDHQIITEISDEQFEGGAGTEIEGALRGIAQFTSANETPGREMIGVLMTDGDPNGCEGDVENLAEIIAGHLESTGIRTFIIGMDGATEENLEELALAGGAEPHDDFCGTLDPPCHYWNVGDGSGDAIANALTAIAGQAVPFRCDYELSEVAAASGGTLDTSTLNVQLTQNGESTIIFNVQDAGACPTEQRGWYYDNNVTPTALTLCENACDLVSAADAGATMSIVGGCEETLVLR